MFLELFCQYTNISLVALNSSDFFFLSFLVVFHTDAAHVGYLFYSRMAAVSRRRSRTISVASRELAGSSRCFFIREHREQKLNMFNFFLAMPNGHGYSRTSSRLLYGTHGIIPDGARPAIRDHPALHPGMCERDLRCSLGQLYLQIYYYQTATQNHSTQNIENPQVQH